MTSPWSRMPWTSLARGNNVSRLAAFVFAERLAGTRTFRSYQRQQQQQQQQQQHGRGVLGGGARKLLASTAFVSAAGLGYVLYKWRDDIRQGVKNFFILNYPIVRAVSLFNNRDKYNFIADVVEISAPAVVCIEIRDIRDTKDISTGFYTRKSIQSNGSGFIISQDGLILTNAHVVMKSNSSVQVQLYDGTTYAGVVEDIDLQSDLATVRINKTNLPVMKLGSSANVRPGEFVVAIGSPLALNNTITSGIVSNVNRQSEQLGINNQHIQYIQTDAAIVFGNSGGPLVNLNGEAIGINAMRVTPGISFAIPIDFAKEFLKKVELRKKNKSVTEPKEVPRKRYIGIMMQTLTPEILDELQQYNKYMIVQHGVLVWRVMIGSPAYNAGLQPGDIITHANGKMVLNSNNIYQILEEPGNIKLQILRKGQILYIEVEPENV